MTKWCISCARQNRATRSTFLVEDDPMCDVCKDVAVKQLGVASVIRMREPEPVQPRTVVAAAPRPARPRPEKKPRKQREPKPFRMRISQEVRQAIAAAAPEVTHSELAGKYGISDTSVIAIRREAGVVITSRGGHRIDDDLRQAVVSADPSIPSRQLARDLKIAASSVVNICREAGIARATAVQSTAKENTMPQGQRISDEVRKAILDAPIDVTHAELARQHGISDVSVLTIRKQANPAPRKEGRKRAVLAPVPPITAAPVANDPAQPVYVQLTDELAARIFSTHAGSRRQAGGVAADSAATESPAKTQECSMSQYLGIAIQIGELVEQKSAAYGSSFAKAGEFLRLLYPAGIDPHQYDDALLLVRIFDKQMRIATDRDALGESPYRDIAGYGILGAALHEQKKGSARSEQVHASVSEAGVPPHAEESEGSVLLCGMPRSGLAGAARRRSAANLLEVRRGAKAPARPPKKGK